MSKGGSSSGKNTELGETQAAQKQLAASLGDFSSQILGDETAMGITEQLKYLASQIASDYSTQNKLTGWGDTLASAASNAQSQYIDPGMAAMKQFLGLGTSGQADPLGSALSQYPKFATSQSTAASKKNIENTPLLGSVGKVMQSNAADIKGTQSLQSTAYQQVQDVLKQYMSSAGSIYSTDVQGAGTAYQGAATANADRIKNTLSALQGASASNFQQQELAAKTLMGESSALSGASSSAAALSQSRSDSQSAQSSAWGQIGKIAGTLFGTAVGALTGGPVGAGIGASLGGALGGAASGSSDGYTSGLGGWDTYSNQGTSGWD